MTPDFELPAHEIEPEPIREPHQTWVCKQCQKTEYTADDYFRWRKPDDEDDLPIEPPPAPAATASAVVSAASRALYDPASGNPPPPGWVAPGR